MSLKRWVLIHILEKKEMNDASRRGTRSVTAVRLDDPLVIGDRHVIRLSHVQCWRIVPSLLQQRRVILEAKYSILPLEPIQLHRLRDRYPHVAVECAVGNAFPINGAEDVQVIRLYIGKT